MDLARLGMALVAAGRRRVTCTPAPGEPKWERGPRARRHGVELPPRLAGTGEQRAAVVDPIEQEQLLF